VAPRETGQNARQGGGNVRRLACALALAAAALLAAACTRTSDEGSAAHPLVYDGSTSISNRILPDALARFQERTGLLVQVRTSGAGKGLEAVLASRADVAGVARVLSNEELAGHPYVQIIGYDALAVWVNGQNPIRGLTQAQLQAIFTGKVTSWHELGGPDRPMIACTEFRNSRRATVDAFAALALEGSAYAPGIRELEDPSDCLRLVAEEPGGITPASVAYAIPGVRTIPVNGLEPTPHNVRANTYLLTRPLLLVSREEPRGALRQLFDFLLSPEGQQIVARNGFVPAR
jgi:phosphate transport system substrate-binding protein